MAETKTLLFDFDGTLMDTTNVIINSWQQVYRTITGAEGDEKVILGTFGSVLGESLVRAFPSEPEEKLVKIYRDYHHDHFLELIDLYPGISGMLPKAREKVRNMALVTSRLKKTTMMAVKEFGLDRFFDCIITADDCSEHKPDPQPVLIALEKLGTDPDGAIMVGDTLLDRECARRAGISSALVSWAPSIDVKKLEGNDRPDHILEKPSDILDIL